MAVGEFDLKVDDQELATPTAGEEDGSPTSPDKEAGSEAGATDSPLKLDFDNMSDDTSANGDSVTTSPSKTEPTTKRKEKKIVSFHVNTIFAAKPSS